MRIFKVYSSLLLFLCLIPLTGCLLRTRPVVQHASMGPLKSATQVELVEYVNTQANKIQTMQATVDIDTTVGGAKKGKITDYQQIRGYVLARKPTMLRMIGLMPLVRNRAFDMVSNGQTFKLWIPPKNKFMVGKNDAETHNSKQPMENLRPQHIYDALLLREVDSDPLKEITFLESETQTVTDVDGHKIEQPDYVLNVIRKGDNGWFLSRKIMFSRTDLLPYRQVIYDPSGEIATDARYGEYKEQDAQLFPSKIRILRPQDEYDITLHVLKLQLNGPLPDDKFDLQQPDGAQVVQVGKPQANEARGGSGRGESQKRVPTERASGRPGHS